MAFCEAANRECIQADALEDAGSSTKNIQIACETRMGMTAVRTAMCYADLAVRANLPVARLLTQTEGDQNAA